MSLKFKLCTIIAITFAVILLDQSLKNWAVNELSGQPERVYFGGFFQLVYGENPGAFLGMGGDWSRGTRFVIFSALVAVGLCGMLWYLLKRESSKINLVAYSFIIAGGFGNLGDRLFNDNGHVVDFLFIQIAGPVKTGIFNFADVAIVIGVLIAFSVDFFSKKKRKNVQT